MRRTCQLPDFTPLTAVSRRLSAITDNMMAGLIYAQTMAIMFKPETLALLVMQEMSCRVGIRGSPLDRRQGLTNAPKRKRTYIVISLKCNAETSFSYTTVPHRSSSHVSFWYFPQWIRRWQLHEPACKIPKDGAHRFVSRTSMVCNEGLPA